MRSFFLNVPQKAPRQHTATQLHQTARDARHARDDYACAAGASATRVAAYLDRNCHVSGQQQMGEQWQARSGNGRERAETKEKGSCAHCS